MNERLVMGGVTSLVVALIDCSCNLGDKHLLFYAMIPSLEPS